MPCDKTIDDTAEDTTLMRLVDLIKAEADAFAKLLPAALAAQWTPAPAGRTQKEPGARTPGTHNDPTSVIALDDKRLALRHQLARSAMLLRRNAIELRGVRRGLQHALTQWEGSHPNEIN